MISCSTHPKEMNPKAQGRELNVGVLVQELDLGQMQLGISGIP